MTLSQSPIGLYVHVPFCAQRCAYCNFVLTTHSSESLKLSYFNGLKKQFDDSLNRYGPLQFNTLYFGGGTPSELNCAQIDTLFDALGSKDGKYVVDENAEITVEMNPADVDEERVAKWMSHGMNRVSLGAQSFNDALLKKINRNHQAKDILESIRVLRQAGIVNISLDLIIKLPDQRLEDVQEACRQSVDLGVQQVVLYDLEVHEKTAFGVLQKKRKLTLPDEDVHLKMYEAAQDILCSKNKYEQYELLSFALLGYESKHNLKYWHNEAYLGLGPGAYSYLEQVRYQYCTSVNRFLTKTDVNDFSRDVEDILTPSEIELETLLTGLRLKEGVEKRHFQTIRPQLDRCMQGLIDGGFIQDREEKLYLTQNGIRVAEDVFREMSDLASFI